MSAANPADAPRSATPAAFSSFPVKSWRLRVALAVVGLGLAAALVYGAAIRHPDAEPPKGAELEGRMAGIFGVPADKDDDRVVGDFLIERFYVIDADTGERYVGDLMKGRIASIQLTTQNGIIEYTLLLDLYDLYRDGAAYSVFVEDAARPTQSGTGKYLGLRVQGGLFDAFKLNYSGVLPERRPAFRNDGKDLQEFLASQRFSEVTTSHRLIEVEGYNYLLSNSEVFPHFRSQFATGRAIFVSELLIVDATSPEQEGLLNRLKDIYPRVPQP